MISGRTPHPRRGAWRERYLPLALYVGIGTYLWLVQLFTRHRWRDAPILAPWNASLSDYTTGWVGRDARDILLIAHQGYDRPRLLVLFPLYSLLIRAGNLVLHDPREVGIVITWLSGLALAYGLWVWMRNAGMSEQARVLGLLVFSLYPYSWYLYGLVYGDALFVALSVWAFVAIQKDRLFVAGLLGALATASRPSGYAVAAALFVVALEHSQVLQVATDATGWVGRLRLPVQVDRTKLHPRLLWPLLAWGGLGAYMVWLQIAWGEPMAWYTKQSLYHAGGPASYLKEQYFDAPQAGMPLSYVGSTTLSVAILVLVLASVAAVGRRFGWGYATLVFLAAAIPAVSLSTFMGVGRYLLIAFPCFALLGEWLVPHRRLAVAGLAVSTVLVGVMAAGFSLGTYLA